MVACIYVPIYNPLLFNCNTEQERLVLVLKRRVESSDDPLCDWMLQKNTQKNKLVCPVNSKTDANKNSASAPFKNSVGVGSTVDEILQYIATDVSVSKKL